MNWPWWTIAICIAPPLLYCLFSRRSRPPAFLGLMLRQNKRLFRGALYLQVSRTFTEFFLEIRNFIGWKFLMSNVAKNLRLILNRPIWKKCKQNIFRKISLLTNKKYKIPDKICLKKNIKNNSQFLVIILILFLHLSGKTGSLRPNAIIFSNSTLALESFTDTITQCCPQRMRLTRRPVNYIILLT